MDDSASLRGHAPSEEATGPASSTGRSVALAAGLAVLAAVTTWLFGHLPWVLSGFSWPTAEAVPVGSSTEGLAGVRLTVPLVAAFLPSLIAFTAIGSVAAALLPLVLTTRSGRRRVAIAVALASLAVTTVVVTLLARSTILREASDAFAGDTRVLRGLVLVVLVTATVAGLLGTLASVQVGLLPLAAALAAGQLPVWVEGFLVGRSTDTGAVRAVETGVHWLVLVVMLVAFVLSVRRTAAWALLWPLAIAVIWVATPFRIMTIQLASQLRPSSGLPGSLPDILQGAVDVFRASFWEAPQTVWPWVVALLAALVWLVVEQGVRRGRRQRQR